MTEESSSQQVDNAEVVAPPVWIFSGFLAVGIMADFLWPVWNLDLPGRVIAFLVFAVPGAVLVNRTFSRFREAETTANPYGSVSAIISDGPFRFTRNPIYVAMFIIHTGTALGFGGLFSLLALAPILAIMHFGVVLREEAYLERKYGKAYIDYKVEVRRWL